MASLFDPYGFGRFRFGIIAVLLFALLMVACSKTSSPQADLAVLPLRMNLQPAIEHGFDVDLVQVRITKGSFSSQMDLTITGNTALGSFNDLEAGTYAIDVWVYSNTVLIATGQGNATVIPAQTTTVYITLQFVPGALEINIGWALPYEYSRRVLLIGNSHTYFNDGVDTHLQALLNSAVPQWNTNISSITMGGATLQNHLNSDTTLNAINNGEWDLIILQEQSSRPMTDPQLFYDAAISLNTLIRNSGALTGFYMTWAWRNNPEMYIPVRNAYSYIAAYLDALLIPAGVAFYNASQDYPMLDLYAADNFHPSLQGTYLVSCLMLGQIWNINPIGNRYYPNGMDSTTALQIQSLAFSTLSGIRNERLIKSSLPSVQPYSAISMSDNEIQGLYTAPTGMISFSKQRAALVD